MSAAGTFYGANTFFSPAGPPFSPTSAANGLSVDPVTKKIVLGNDTGGTLATLLSNREIPLLGFSLKMKSGTAATNLTNLVFSDDPGFIVVENDELGSVAPLTTVGYKIRTKPGAVPPFDLPFELSMQLTNQGGAVFLLQDKGIVPAGLTNWMFKFQDSGGTGVPISISNGMHVAVFNTFGVAAGGPVNGARSSVLFDGVGINTAFAIKNGDPSAVSGIQMLFVNDINVALMRLNSSANLLNPSMLLIDNGALSGDILLRSGTGNARVKFNVGLLVNGGNAAGTAIDINGAITINDAVLMHTKTAFTNGAAAQVGTLLNAPTAGNPTKWIPVDDNGTTRFIPAW
jgi:hypothetical protein